MTDLIIKPWIGGDCGTSTLFPGSRILILGESFYGKPQEDKPEETASRLTRLYFDNKFKTKKKRRFWLSTNNLFMKKRGGSLVRNQAKEFWNSVAFNNYIRHTTLSKPRKHVPDEYWTTAKELFPALLDETKPTFIAVMGFGVWRHLPKNYEKGCVIPDAPKGSRQTRIFHYTNGTALAFRLPHPSSGRLTYKDWYGSLMKAIEESKNLS